MKGIFLSREVGAAIGQDKEINEMGMKLSKKFKSLRKYYRDPLTETNITFFTSAILMFTIYNLNL